ncbi:MAG: hypothetical protein HOV77_16695 [Hamadaea sp.]|uniref:hypothetical protein n=1 Tax=Hamadaea sp. TaxID=2024425 RepID=UPI0017B10F16|nr:hypothetical protein [Hamadaea sp.]NUT20821.1 hypothetical protein [Hamadaea sp.]
MTEPDPLVRALVGLVAELAFRLDGSDEELVDERWAVKALEWIAYVCGQLPPEQRLRLVGVMAELAAEARPGPEREFLESFAENFGLLDGDTA